MAHKRKPLPLILALPVLFFIVAAAQAEDILNFNQTTGLPTCAYGCKDIYSAKFGCESSSDFLSCFCGSEYLSDKPERWGCDDWCVTRAERDRVAIFLETTCGSIKVDGEDPAKDPAKDPSKPSTKESPVKDAAAEKSQTPDIKPATAPEAAEEGNASDPNKSKNW